MRRLAFGLAIVLAVAGFCIVVASRSNAALGGRPLSAVLSGLHEVPGPGDPDGEGEAVLTLNQGQGLICYELSVGGIAPATAAHIHAGAVDVAGPVVAALDPPTGGFSSGCVSVDSEEIADIRKAPEEYYINVHNAEFNNGAVRGQLSR